MIFDRDNGDLEVWRCSSSIPEHVVDESSAPDAGQREVYGLQSSGTDGYFQPWAVLHMPKQTSGFRFVYPTLVVAGYDFAYLWDIPSGKLIQTIECPLTALEGDNGHYFDEIVDVAVSERHVFIASQVYMRIFSRETGESVLNLSWLEYEEYGIWKYHMGTFSHRSEGVV